ncbi:type IV secretory system conjugative DNA transfer family protein [Streptomyces sp. JB150]|uniref:type IV secretory system conjugative DNA transfer family protein n=1 Tax=Streptomyces sp. JB150 TaxID=2714844 RepID=UPI0014081468|nr:type IV secretory system conjugative DNA transfer family protein [Streptomyces sp. JB150]QIJ63467.1 type VI secretion protein [Streptomyces sp. JB150]
MRPDDRDSRRSAQGGIPDGLLIGILAFLLGMTLMVWSATGLAAWFAHGAWPDTVTFARTPLAMRSLIAQPHDIPGAWPDTPAGQLSGYGLFWGLFIGQLMVLVVLSVFVLGTVARWRAGRARRRHQPVPEAAPTPASAGAPEPQYEVPTPRREPDPAPAHAAAGPVPAPAPLAPAQQEHAVEARAAEARAEPVPQGEGHGQVPYEPVPAPAPAPAPTPAGQRLILAPRELRHATAVQAVRDAAGPTLVVTSNPALWSDTKDARAKLGPVLLYDPHHLCDTPSRLHWSPTAGCESQQTAVRRAVALLAPVRPTARIDQAVTDTAETLLRCCLHAAALDGRTIRHVHRWSQGTHIQEAVRTLRTHPKAAPGSAGELESALTAHPERRDMAQQLIGRALSALSTVHVREACTPNRNDALALDSFIAEGGSLYVVGESIEDPRTDPGAMPFLTALVSSVVEHGRRMAERSSPGRLDPPVTLVLDDVAAVAPLPQLPDLLATGPDRGMPTLALLRSREQARSRWPHDELPL